MDKGVNPKNVFMQKIALLTVMSALSLFFAMHGMLFMCFFFMPVLYILNNAPEYKMLNTQEEVNEKFAKPKVGKEEAANYMTEFLKILWPNIFSQERVEQFKASLQWVVDQQKIPYLEKLVLKEIKLGNTSPQITFIKVPEKPRPADKSILMELQAIYYPSFVLNALLTLKNPSIDVNVSFNNLTVSLDMLIQFEFKEDPDLPEIPFCTAMDFSLTKTPQIMGFDVTVGSMTSLFNGEDLKKRMSTAAGSTIWWLCGQPNGFLWERNSGAWKMATVFGKTRMKRSSMKHRDLIRDSIIRSEALDYIRKFKISMPLALISTSYKDQETTTKYFQLLLDLGEKEKMNLEKFDNFVSRVSGWVPSADELKTLMSKTYDFIFEWFAVYSKKLIAQKMGITKEAEVRIGKIMTYINFLSAQKKNCPKIYDELGLERKVDTLFAQISSTQEKLLKAKKN